MIPESSGPGAAARAPIAGWLFRPLRSDLAHEGAPVGEKSAWSVGNVFGRHPYIAVEVRNSGGVVAPPCRAVTWRDLVVAGEPVVGKRTGARDVDVTRPRRRAYPGASAAGTAI